MPAKAMFKVPGNRRGSQGENIHFTAAGLLAVLSDAHQSGCSSSMMTKPRLLT